MSIQGFTFQDITELQNWLDAKEQRLLKWKATMQPFIIAIGKNLKAIEHLFVRVNRQMYRVNSLLKGIDVCFKVIFALNAKYSVECEQLWLFIQYFMYEIKCPNDKISIGVRTLLNDLSNAMSKS